MAQELYYILKYYINSEILLFVQHQFCMVECLEKNSECYNNDDASDEVTRSLDVFIHYMGARRSLYII